MKVAVMGAGTVGLLAAVRFAEQGHDVVCADLEGRMLTAIESGILARESPELAEQLRRHLAAGRLRFVRSRAAAVRHGRVIFMAVRSPHEQRSDR